MISKFVALKQEIDHREAALSVQRRGISWRYQGLKTGYRRRLSSPTTLVTSLAAGLVVGLLSRRSRRSAKLASTAAKRHWFTLARAIAGPAVLHILRTKGVDLINNAIKR